MNCRTMTKLNFLDGFREYRHETAFTVSIDHVDTTTVISVTDDIYIDEMWMTHVKIEDFRRPGHVFR